MNTHAIFLLKKGGILIYYMKLSTILEKTDPALISSFLRAIMDFSSAVMKKEINVLDIGDLRFTFYNPDPSHEDNLIFIIVTDIGVSVLLVREWIKQIAKKLFNIYPMESCNDIDCMIEDNKLDQAIKAVLVSTSPSNVTVESIEAIFKDELDRGEISGGAMFTLKGDIIYNSLPSQLLNQALKEVEIRSQADTLTLNKKLPKLIWQTGEVMLFSQMVKSTRFKQLVVVDLLFEISKAGNLGMADFVLESVVKKMTPLL
jgi:hypothetical protein